ncbi:hypothetical protein GCM10010218_65460 [Streptomyces mashuensis]|uniref:Uncharacterized protein n=1 Tax=Streptomyces mashuensis TaxID=33904 RepID=A0A919EGY0_9ACTN|nr:hypothetical protein [Streptomyces mashuensis]GHF75443.1 hypothetical protein GCM10010218_65460 [Streptomyces mashuensis]
MDHDRTAAERPLSDDEANARARQLIEEAYAPPTSYRDPSPVPAYGPTPPVAQPGRPPMSQKATDASALMLSGSVAALSVGGATSLVLYTLGHVDPTTLAIGAAGPVALVLAVGSLIRSVGRAKQDMHTEHHHHYNGSVRQETTNVSSTTSGLFAKNRNDVR